MFSGFGGCAGGGIKYLEAYRILLCEIWTTYSTWCFSRKVKVDFQIPSNFSEQNFDIANNDRAIKFQIVQYFRFYVFGEIFIQ